MSPGPSSNGPWALLPSTLAIVGEVVRLRLAESPLTEDEIRERVAIQAQTYGQRLGAQRVGTVQVIPLYGVITQRASMMSEYSGGTSLDTLRGAIEEALNDPEVTGIVLDVDSPGGSVDGLPEFASWLRKTVLAPGAKPMVGVADTMAASAAYWILSQLTEVVVTPSGAVGSVGVYLLHWDYSAELEMEGEKPTFISAAPFKTEGNPYEPLSEEAVAALQREVDHFYSGPGMFLQSIRRARPGPGSSANVPENYGGGRMVMPADALAAGMVDRIDTLEGVIGRMNRGQRVRTGSRAEGGSLEPAELHTVTITSEEVLPTPLAGPVQRHTTDTTDDPWDAAANEKRLPSPMTLATARDAYAWYDDAQVTDGEITKVGCKFLHHEVSASGTPGAANLTACSTGIGYLNRPPGSNGRPDIPDADREGTYAHLAGHLEDAGRDAPPLSSSTDPAHGPRALTPQRDQIAAAAADFRRSAHPGTRPWFRD